ncbi:unnamed protein product [Cylindrotheca closterium]|uniref:Glycosyltransferase family 92 protein n=1 Tax=Cylindrotheca closterium TaxID=2856 RepID=A0AAD2FNS7_9STRA|nr:unnamed protein product [Cylindrotheca closterium]
MPLPRQKRPRQTVSWSSLSSSSLPNNPLLYQKKKKVIKNREVQAFIFVIFSLAVFPLLFLHQSLLPSDSKHHHNHSNKNETKIQNSLNDYYKQRQEHRDEQHHDWKPKPAPSTIGSHNENNDKVLMAYLEPVDTITMLSASGDGGGDDSSDKPRFIRQTSAKRLTTVVFPRPKASDNGSPKKDPSDVCSSLMQDFPIDEFPMEDPYLPWIHDYFPSANGKHIQFVAQNRRRCQTGKGKEQVMKFWEPQVALFQSIPVTVVIKGNGDGSTNNNNNKNDPPTYTQDDQFFLSSNMESATHKATRFQCHFHTTANGATAAAAAATASVITFSEHNFDYEFVNWRKGRKTMLNRQQAGKDLGSYWLSQLLFRCPVPSELQPLLADGNSEPRVYLDLIPIRTPVRTRELLLTTNSTGPGNVLNRIPMLDLKKAFGDKHLLPRIQDAGRWANLPLCPRETTGSAISTPFEQQQQKHQLVACTWTASSYTRRGDTFTISDSGMRLEEWIRFHLQVGFDHLYIYDNSDGNSTDLLDVTNKFGKDSVTYHRWPCRVCNNNRPAHKNPGERSSQYAAEASCRERYGDSTEWMSFIDTDEYLVPMQRNEQGDYHWKPVLEEMDTNGISIMKFLSSRGLPRVDLMEIMEDQSSCVDPNDVTGENKDKTEPCIAISPNKTTYLQVYNCDYIRPPKPERFQRAMKQIYRPSHVLSHFVHYSTVTADLAETYSDFVEKKKDRGDSTNDQDEFILREKDPRFKVQSKEVFVNELTQGALIHARSILPHETRRRSAECFAHSKFKCMLGYLCDDSVDFSDEKHKENDFTNPDGSYCNCWRNPVVDDVLGPVLLKRLQLDN